MTREKALAEVESIISTHLQLHGVELGERGKEAFRAAVTDLRLLVEIIYEESAGGRHG